jgi:hypothetical protein
MKLHSDTILGCLDAACEESRSEVPFDKYQLIDCAYAGGTPRS